MKRLLLRRRLGPNSLALAVAAAALIAGSGGIAAAAEFDPHPPQAPAVYADQVRTSFYLPMRDGAKLAVDLYRPARDGKPVEGRFPVIWQATNDRGFGFKVDPKEPGLSAVPSMTRWGYVVAVVDRRGMGASAGQRRGYHDRNEDFDSYEVTEWLAAQPWSDGKVGIYGCSNTGEAVMHAVSVAPPHLKAAWAGCFSWNKYDGMLRGGVFANWGTGPERTFDDDMKLRPVDNDTDKAELRRAADDHRRNTVLRDLWAGMPFRDSFSPLTASRFWAEGSVSSYADQVRRSGVPIYIMGGWYDDFREQGLVAYANLPAGKRRIIIGPWRHCANNGVDLVAEMKRFFDFHLKGLDDAGFSAADPIRYFTLNAPPETAWRSAKAWPLPDTRVRTLHLAPGATAGEGVLSARAPDPGSSGATRFQVSYAVDCVVNGKVQPVDLRLMVFLQPCPSPRGGPSFTSQPMAKDTEITGSPVGDLWITSDQPDANVFVYLEDVAPDGSATPMTDGRLKASLRKVSAAPWAMMGLPWHRSFAEDAEPLKPGEPARLSFSFLPVSYIVKAGHRLRVSVAGADYRERDRTPVTPAPVLTILDTPEHGSTVSLPIIEGGRP